MTLKDCACKHSCCSFVAVRKRLKVRIATRAKYYLQLITPPQIQHYIALNTRKLRVFYNSRLTSTIDNFVFVDVIKMVVANKEASSPFAPAPQPNLKYLILQRYFILFYSTGRAYCTRLEPKLLNLEYLSSSPIPCGII